MRSRDRVSLFYLFWLEERKVEASRANSVLFFLVSHIMNCSHFNPSFSGYFHTPCFLPISWWPKAQGTSKWFRQSIGVSGIL